MNTLRKFWIFIQAIAWRFDDKKAPTAAEYADFYKRLELPRPMAEELREAKKRHLRSMQPGAVIFLDEWDAETEMLLMEIENEDAEYRRRMRGGYDIAGIP